MSINTFENRVDELEKEVKMLADRVSGLVKECH